MAAFWLTYKPFSRTAARGWPPEQMDALVVKFEADRLNATPLWRIATKAALVGDRVYLFKQGSGRRGIFGVGEIIEPPREQIDTLDIEAGSTMRARIRLTHLVNPVAGFLLDFDAIADLVPKSLAEAQRSGNRVPDDVARALENRLAISIVPSSLSGDEADHPEFDPASIDDERERAFRSIRIRRGQSAFRDSLMIAYGRRCAITDCAVEDVLEAAHIHPYLGTLTHHVSNGLLLRTDVHTLFDCGLISIEPMSRTIVVAEALIGSCYAKLSGRKLRGTEDPLKSASRRSLERRYATFSEAHLRYSKTQPSERSSE